MSHAAIQPVPRRGAATLGNRMPKPATERPITESMTVVLRLQRQLDMSSVLKPAQKDRIKESLGEVLIELQQASQSKPKRSR